MPVSHVSLPTGEAEFDRMREFYLAVLSPLGYGIFKEERGCYAGFAPKHGAPDFWLHSCYGTLTPFDPKVDSLEKREGKTHLAFAAKSEREVREWHEVALKAGGVDNGKPGERPQYVKGYYAAFVIDPLGNNLEVCYWSPWWLKLMIASPTILASVVAAGLGVGLARYLA